MQKLFLLLLAAYGLTATALAFNPEQTRASYNNCINYLKLPRAKQIEVARGSGYSLAQVDRACRNLRRTGLAESIRLEREYQRAVNGGYTRGSGSGGSSGVSQPRSCYGQASCSLSQHCVDRRCVDKIRVHCAERGMYSCSAGEKCVSGVCR